MSLVDALMLPSLSRKAGHSNKTPRTGERQRPRMSRSMIEKDSSSPVAIENTLQQTDRTRPSYRDSLPHAPRPVCPSSFEEDSTLGSAFDGDSNNSNNMLAPSRPPKTGGMELGLELELDADTPPAVPQRSTLRTSRMFSSFAELKQPASSTTASATVVTLAHAEPHEIYLSSEEDASSSADHFSDDESVSENNHSHKRSKSQEDTARVVSVVFSGRPSIISVSPVRSASPASSIDSDYIPAPRPLERAATDSSLGTAPTRRLSITSIGSMSLRHPPRTSSMYLASSPTISSSSSITNSKKPAFLSIDPFACANNSANQSPIEEEVESYDIGASPAPRTPKTPSAMFRRGLNLVKKRSRPLLSNFGPFEPNPTSMPALHIRTSLERTHEPLPGFHTPVSALSLPQGDFHHDTFLAKPTRKVSTPVTTPISAPLSPGFSPASLNTGSPAKGGRGKLLGFRRQSLSLRGAP